MIYYIISFILGTVLLVTGVIVYKVKEITNEKNLKRDIKRVSWEKAPEYILLKNKFANTNVIILKDKEY